MRVIFAQCSIKLATMNSLFRLPVTRFYSTKLKSSRKNHYDTLKITPYATQNQVKSAYYKLSLQYHPDKNKSDYAKQKFQDISDAYEILNNHETRKNYDRQMMIRQQPISSEHEESTLQSRSNTYSGTSTVYNFDAWIQAHYGRQFQVAQERRNQYKQNKEAEDMLNKETKSQNVEIFLFFVSLLLIVAFFLQNHDTPVSKTKECTEEIETRKN